MPTSPESPLERAVRALREVLATKERARRWYERYLATLGSRAVVDTQNGGMEARIHRRAAGESGVLPLPAVAWTRVHAGHALREGIQLYDGRQRISLLYDDAGMLAEGSHEALYPGRLVGLPRALADAADRFEASIAFVANLDDAQQGPGRIHYPVPTPGGVKGAWNAGLSGCRRALFDDRLDPEVRFLVADGIAGTAIGVGTTLEEALGVYAAEVGRAFPAASRDVRSINDVYDDAGNRIARGEPPPESDASEPRPEASTWIHEADDPGASWRGDEASAEDPLEPRVDPETGRFGFGPWVLRGPTPDAPPPPRRADCVPYVMLPLEAALESPLPRGRWVRALGALGVTRHVVRLEAPDGFTLVGADLLGLVDLKGLAPALDAADAAHDARAPVESERPAWYRARQCRWAPARASRPEGLCVAGGSRGPQFDPGGLDGDLLQAQVYRFRRAPRPAD